MNNRCEKMKFVDCKELKVAGLEALEKQTSEKEITLKVIQVKGDKASDIYVRNKAKASLKAGIHLDHILLDEDVQMEEILYLIESFNNDDAVNGIMVQLPLPKHLNESSIINAINPDKDVDGLTNINLGKIVANEEGLRPCTAQGVMEVLDNVIGLDNLVGKKVTIIGRTKLVGLPLFHMLLNLNATPVICHTKTENLSDYTQTADILITAAGASKPFIGSDMIKDGAIVIDVSTVKDDDGKFHGDVIYGEVKDKASYVSPVPGGIGQLTVLELLRNTYKAYLFQHAIKNDKGKQFVLKN